jgi:hypothetical protein
MKELASAFAVGIPPLHRPVAPDAVAVISSSRSVTTSRFDYASVQSGGFYD